MDIAPKLAGSRGKTTKSWAPIANWNYPPVNLHSEVEHHIFFEVHQPTQWPFSSSLTVRIYVKLPEMVVVCIVSVGYPSSSYLSMLNYQVTIINNNYG